MTKEELFNDNIRIAYKIANKYKTNYFNEYDDILQCAFEGLWRACLVYDEKWAFSTIAYKCVTSRINYYLRNVKKHSEHNTSIYQPIGENLYLEDMLASEGDDVEDLLDNVVVSQIKKAVVDVIDDRKQTVFNLYLQGHTQKQIGEKLGLSQPQVSREQKKIHTTLNNMLNAIS